MEPLPPTNALQHNHLECFGRLWGEEGAQVAARRLLENGVRQTGDTSLN